MFVAFLDASKAFDNINHNILFQRLKDNNIPLYIIIFLNYWYRNQRIYIKRCYSVFIIDYYTIVYI